mgnify:CR=1 FL=1
MTDRPAHTEDEVEVTPEMIEAGAEALVWRDSRVEGVEEVAERVFRAMWAVSPGAAARNAGIDGHA